MGFKTLVGKASALVGLGVMFVNMGLDQVNAGNLLEGGLMIAVGAACIIAAEYTGLAPLAQAGMVR